MGKTNVCYPIPWDSHRNDIPMDKPAETTAIKILCSKQAASLFFQVQMQWKMYFFVPFVRPCMHHNYGGISENHACKDCVWPIILDAELYTTCPGERVLVVMTHQVQCNIPTFEAILRKHMHLFLERCRRSNNVMVACFDAVRLFIFVHILWTLPTTAFYVVAECSDIAVFARLGVCISRFIRTLPGFDQFRN